MTFIRVPWLHARAITFWRWCFYTGDDLSARTKNHERIHGAQWGDDGLAFVWYYVTDWFRAAWATGDWRIMGLAYRSIRYEQEAYAFEHRPDYLRVRKPGAWRSFPLR